MRKLAAFAAAALVALSAVVLIYLAPAFADVAPVAVVTAPVVPPSPMLDIFVQYVLPILGTIIGLGLTWLMALLKSKFGLQIEQQQRDALQTALTNAAGLLLQKLGADGVKALNTAHPDVGRAVNYVVKSAPAAVKAFGLDKRADELAQKVIAKVGVLTAPAAAVLPVSLAPAPR
jgi:hypothetical protein